MKKNIKGRFLDVLSMLSNALGGKLSEIDETLHEIYFENEIKGTSITLTISRKEKENGEIITDISIKQGIMKNKATKNLITFRELERVYLSILPNTEITFLTTHEGRFSVVILSRDTSFDVIYGIDRRSEDSYLEDEEQEEDDININTKNKESFYEEANRKKKSEIERRRIFITL